MVTGKSGFWRPERLHGSLVLVDGNGGGLAGQKPVNDGEERRSYAGILDIAGFNPLLRGIRGVCLPMHGNYTGSFCRPFRLCAVLAVWLRLSLATVA